MDHLKLTHEKLSVDAISDLVVDDSCGAVSIFVGTTRDNFEGKRVLSLVYEAYESMALKAMKSICDDIRIRWSQVHAIAIYHRLGEVPTREASVVIAISSPHRAASLDAVSHCIDSLKSSVPIWKKEVYDGEAPAWKENSECEQQGPAVDRSMVQINVSNEELMQRIQNFIDRKREQVNISNVADFTPSSATGGKGEGAGVGCARVDSILVRRKDNAKGHLKMSKVHNEWGPQLSRPAATRTCPPAGSLPAGIAERVSAAERFLRVTPVPADVYQRLKVIEDRIAALEAVSPEYSMFWGGANHVQDIKLEGSTDCLYTADDIAKKIEMLEGQE